MTCENETNEKRLRNTLKILISLIQKNKQRWTDFPLLLSDFPRECRLSWSFQSLYWIWLISGEKKKEGKKKSLVIPFKIKHINMEYVVLYLGHHDFERIESPPFSFAQSPFKPFHKSLGFSARWNRNLYWHGIKTQLYFNAKWLCFHLYYQNNHSVFISVFNMAWVFLLSVFESHHITMWRRASPLSYWLVLFLLRSMTIQHRAVSTRNNTRKNITFHSQPSHTVTWAYSQLINSSMHNEWE